MCGLTRGLDLAVLRESIRRSETAATGPPQSGGHGRLDGDRLPGWSHLGCDRAGPSLHGPWMAVLA